MNNEVLINCFRDTIEQTNSILKKKTAQAIKSNQVYKENFLSNVPKRNENSSIIVQAGTTFEAARQFCHLGKVAVLNFANPENPGDGVNFGAMAQEECLCRSSNLYPCISDENVFDDYYLYHRTINNHFYTDRLIYTKGVTVFKDDSVINNVRISRCLFYVSNVLQDVIDNGGAVRKIIQSQKLPFSITEAQCSKILVTQDPVGVSIISKRIGEVLDENVKTLPATHITTWLVDNGYLVENIYSGSKKKGTTPKGEQLGILTIDAVNSQGMPYKKNIYDANAQKFIITNLNKIAADIAAKQV